MLGESSSGGDAVAVAGGGGGSTSGDEGERGGSGGNRWPRQETLALLRIRSDMDVAFRLAPVKAPLWEQVSRKLAELGYNRNAKKCKEKFENIYKYHKRTKEGRSGKSEGKTYRFFDELEALHNLPPPNPPQQSFNELVATTTVTVPMTQVVNNTTHSSVPCVTVPSTTTIATPLQSFTLPHDISVTYTPSITLPNIPSFPPTSPTIFPTLPPLPSQAATSTNPINIPNPFLNFPNDLFSNSSSSTSSDEKLEETRKRKRNHKWEDFFQGLMEGVVKKQEEQQRAFLEAIEKREKEQMAREEAWRVEEMQRINREREILAQERSIAAAKDAAIMAFLQKLAEQQNNGQALNNINIPTQPIAPQTLVQPQVQSQQPQLQIQSFVRGDNNGENTIGRSSSRWPKVEVEALIKLRSELDTKYLENIPKGPLWEEISSAMRKLGYNRNAKRCKEKWENINKYFKKVKESNKERPQDSKTCPYFHQLDALYKEKNKMVQPESTVAPLMVQPEQQWPPLNHTEEDGEDDDFEEEEEEEEKDNGEEEEDEENKAPSVGGASGE